ncbi:MAG: hypothetical protein RBR02_09460 [Desulfuromonadaceae bacterium]|nr:hypothetical protein [Desulfuromonadaceae bacterium]
MDSDSLGIIETYFKDVGLLPVVDYRGYENIPYSVWSRIGNKIESYERKTYNPGVFKKLLDLAIKTTSKNSVLEFLIRPDSPLKFDKEFLSKYFLLS